MAAPGELYLLAAYLAIGLMSITVPTYAIAVTYLARETSESRKDLQKRRKELVQKLEGLKKRLEDEAGVASILEEIKKYEKEDERLKSRQLYLSVKGAVALPFTSFLLALVVAAYGYYSGSNGVIPLFLLTFMGMGLFLLTKSLLAIEQAAMRPEEILLPDLRATFASKATSMSAKASEKRMVSFLIWNEGKEHAEDVLVMVLFEQGFRVGPGKNYSVVPQPSESEYADYTAVCFELNLMHADTFDSYDVNLTMPEKAGSYSIPVGIHARKIGKLNSELRLEISA